MEENIKNKLEEELRYRGIRITPQRAIIFEAIQKLKGHMTAEDIFQEVQKVNSYISLATVYRTLELLLELKLISQSNLGRNQNCFALKSHGQHHHLVCTACGRVEEVADNVFDPLRLRLKQAYGFESHTEHMSIFGLCQQCRATSETPGENAA